MTKQEKLELAMRAKQEMSKVIALDEAVETLMQTSTKHMANVSKIIQQLTEEEDGR